MDVAKSLESALAEAIASVGLRQREAATRWGVPYSTVRVWVHRGRVTTVRAGALVVIPHAEVERVENMMKGGSDEVS